MLNYSDIKRGVTITQGNVPFLLRSKVKNSFISYIPDSEHDEDGYDEYGNYYDSNCKVYAEERWNAINMYTEQPEIIKINSFYGRWNKLIENKKKYNKTSIDDSSHIERSKIIE